MNALFRFVFRQSKSGRIAALLLLPALSMLPQTSRAQLPTAKLQSLSPPGGQVGTELEVVAAGGDLDEAAQLVFSHPGIQAAVIQVAPGEWDSQAAVSYGKFKVTISADVPAGIYDCWVLGRYGESNPRAFAVGSLPETRDESANRSPTTPKVVALNSVVNGIFDANSVDYYVYDFEEGQRVLIECTAEEIDSRGDPLVWIIGPEGRELMRENNSAGHDAVIDFTVPKTGKYIVGARDIVFSGGADYFYRLKVHVGPRIEFVFPASGQVGASGKFTVFGRNLPGGELSEFQLAGGEKLQKLVVDVTVPASAETLSALGRLGSKQLGLSGQSVAFGAAGAHWLATTTDPVISEQEGENGTELQAQKITVPTEVAGQFYPQRDRDWYEFQAKKGEVYWIDIVSHRLGVSTDPALTVMRVDEKASAQVAAVDDTGDRAGKIQSFLDTSSDDPSYRFVPDRDATYRVLARDQFGGTIRDSSRIYRLRIRREAPDFQLYAAPQQLKVANANQILSSAVSIRKGETMLLQVTANRLGNFAGEIKLDFTGIPDSITLANAMILAGQNSTWVSLTAKPDAAAWSGTMNITGTADLGGTAASRVCRAGAVVWETANKTTAPAVYRVADQLRLAIVNEVQPGAIIPAQMQFTTSRGGSIDVPLKLTRQDGWAETVNFVATDIAAEVKPADVSIDGKVAEGALKVAITNAKAKAGTYKFYLRADTKTKYVRNPEAVVRAEEDLKKLVEKLTALKEEVKTSTAAVTEAKAALAGAADDAKAEAQKQVTELEAALKAKQDTVTQGDAAQKQKTASVDALKKAAAAKDVNFSIYSPIVELTVVDSPLTVEVPETIEIKKGAMADLSVKIGKLYGFAEATKLTVEVDAKSGISAAAIDVAKELDMGVLKLAATAEATGDITLTVVVAGTFNALPVTTKKAITVKVVD
jgi:hypothetical protein